MQPKKMSMGKRVAIAFGSAALLGGGAAVLMSADTQDGAEGGNAPDASHPEWTDGEVSVAQSVDDSMSFGEAFNAARAEVGAGGVFEWHGYIYSTYTEDEWNGMSQTERDEYGSHFSWNGSAANDEVQVTGTGSGSAHHADGSAHHADGGAHIPESGAHNDNLAAADEPDYTQGTGHGEAEVVAVSNDDVDDGEVQILGVEHDANTGFTYAQLNYDDHDAVLVDINGDNTFDVLAVDANDDHHISDNEIMDISGHDITAQSLGIDTGQVGAMTDDSLADM